MAEHWHVFDAACTVGRHLRLGPGGLHSVADLLAEMDHYGIAEAMVIDGLSRENHPSDGNLRIAELVAAEPRLHPAWVALPPGAGEIPEPGLLVEEMRWRGVGALWLLPNQYRYNLSDWCLDELLEPLAAAQVPVFVNNVEVGPHGMWQTDVIDWSQIVDLCRRWPTLPVVVSEFRIRRGQRLAYRALDACQNLHLELSGYWLHRGIEYITRRWGADRLLFGSGWPGLGPHMTLATLTLAEIDDADKRRIAGDNLRDLLAWAGLQHPVYEPPAPADEYVAYARSGWSPGAPAQLPSEPVWDCHGHLGGAAAHYHLPDASLDATVAEMERQGVERGCVFCFTGVFSDEQFGNDLVADAVARFPERFVGFTMLNPHRGHRDAQQAAERLPALVKSHFVL